MYIQNLKMACGHWQEWVLTCAPSVGAVYAEILRTEACARCLARESAQKVGRDLMSEYHRALCRRNTEAAARPFPLSSRRRQPSLT